MISQDVPGELEQKHAPDPPSRNIAEIDRPCGDHDSVCEADAKLQLDAMMEDQIATQGGQRCDDERVQSQEERKTPKREESFSTELHPPVTHPWCW